MRHTHWDVYRWYDDWEQLQNKEREGCSVWDMDKTGYKWITTEALWWVYRGSFNNSNFYATQCKQKLFKSWSILFIGSLYSPLPILTDSYSTFTAKRKAGIHITEGKMAEDLTKLEEEKHLKSSYEVGSIS